LFLVVDDNPTIPVEPPRRPVDKRKWAKRPLLRRIVKRLWNEVHGLVWTLAGTGMVLITLSGQTLTWGVWITVAGLAVHFLAVAGKGSDTDEE